MSVRTVNVGLVARSSSLNKLFVLLLMWFVGCVLVTHGQALILPLEPLSLKWILHRNNNNTVEVIRKYSFISLGKGTNYTRFH